MRWTDGALGQLILSRLREFYREPEAIFWVYGFPILMTVALGIAFWNKPITEIQLVVENSPGAQTVIDTLAKGEDPKFVVKVLDANEARAKLRTGKTQLVVVPASP